MSSIMRARNGLTAEVKYRRSSGLSPELKVAGPSMLGIGYPDSHALPRSAKTRRPRHALPPASGFVLRRYSALRHGISEGRQFIPVAAIRGMSADRTVGYGSRATKLS